MWFGSWPHTVPQHEQHNMRYLKSSLFHHRWKGNKSPIAIYSHKPSISKHTYCYFLYRYTQLIIFDACICKSICCDFRSVGVPLLTFVKFYPYYSQINQLQYSTLISYDNIDEIISLKKKKNLIKYCWAENTSW